MSLCAKTEHIHCARTVYKHLTFTYHQVKCIDRQNIRTCYWPIAINLKLRTHKCSKSQTEVIQIIIITIVLSSEDKSLKKISKTFYYIYLILRLMVLLLANNFLGIQESSIYAHLTISFLNHSKIKNPDYCQFILLTHHKLRK